MDSENNCRWLKAQAGRSGQTHMAASQGAPEGSCILLCCLGHLGSLCQAEVPGEKLGASIQNVH